MAKFTEKAIMDCFLNMLKRKNIDRVTVTDICEECGINRNTFYYYFSDIYDVLDSVLIEETERILILRKMQLFMRHIVRQLLLLLSIVQQLFMCIIPETEILLRNICIIQQNILLDFLLRNILKTISLQKMTESI